MVARLATTTSVIHYEALSLLSRWISSSRMAVRLRILCVVLSCLLAHLVEIAVYAAAYVFIDWMGWGGLSGKSHGEVADHLYFSATSFSTLGIGDVYPTGATRLISGFEAVNGLFLIAWSTSFTYLAMERLWPLHSRFSRDDNEQ
jgi:hypothetical protein